MYYWDIFRFSNTVLSKLVAEILPYWILWWECFPLRPKSRITSSIPPPNVRLWSVRYQPVEPWKDFIKKPPKRYIWTSCIQIFEYDEEAWVSSGTVCLWMFPYSPHIRNMSWAIYSEVWLLPGDLPPFCHRQVNGEKYKISVYYHVRKISRCWLSCQVNLNDIFTDMTGLSSPNNQRTLIGCSFAENDNNQKTNNAGKKKGLEKEDLSTQ